MINQAPLDEMVDGRRGVRPHWQPVLSTLADREEGGLEERRLRLDRAFAEEGISAVLPGTGIGGGWRCDPVPLPIAAAEFAALESALIQRARVIEALLGDLYGPQTLLRDRVLPPSLVFANPGFLRPCCTTGSGPRLPMMQNYAADLMRGPDGQWRVLADRTGRVSGIGHVQQNRRLLIRQLPDAFNAMPLRSLQPYFDAWQDSLQAMAPPGLDRSPAVALLTPGTTHPHWFEHMLVAQALSCALVEAGDLTVRGGKLFLKTLRGPQPVDVLLRRQEGRLLDPLEFGGPGREGVPGLMDAARHGGLRITNDPGSAAAEAPAFAAFLPAIARRLLGEDLTMPGVPTLWLGDEKARRQVLADPDSWLIRPASDGMAHARAPTALSAAERAALLAKIAARPQDFAASERLPFSVAPCAEGDRLEPKPILLRLFLMHDGQRWHTLPGGMARVLSPEDVLTGRLPRQGIAKDVWVLAEERQDIIGPAAQPLHPVAIRRTPGEMPSRVADNLFWLGRHVERLEGAARLMRAALQRVERGGGTPREAAELQAIAACLRHALLIEPEDMPSIGLGTAPLSRALTRAAAEGGSLHVLSGHVFRLVETVRDRLTNDIYLAFTVPLRNLRADALAAGRDSQSLSQVLNAVLRYSAGVAGVAAENMVRGGGSTFLDLGRRLERAMAVAGQLAGTLDQPPNRVEAGLRLALELCDSVITYRSRYLTALQPAPVLDLVAADPGNPRGLAFQCNAIYELLSEMDPDDRTLPGMAAGLLGSLDAVPTQLLAARDQNLAASQLPPRFREFEAELGFLSDAITRRYFALLPPLQTLGQEAAAEPLRGAA